MLYVAIASSVVAILSLAYAVSRGTPPPAAGNDGAGAASAGRSLAESQDDREVAEQTKAAVKGLLDILAASITRFLERTDSYSGELSVSREAIRRATSLDNIKAIEKELLGNLDRLQEANKSYRSQLSDAHDQIALQQEQLAQLEIDVGTDFLTGLPNRRSLERRLRENVDRSNRYGTKFSMAIFDIDLFKRVNDEHGHMAGDRVVQAVGTLLAEHMRSSDFLARYGGEEFVMILPETSDSQAERMCERIRAHVENATFKYAGDAIRITLSAGVGEVLKPQDTPDNLFERVDAALYSAKETGRNKVVCAI